MTYESDNPQFDHLINNMDSDEEPVARRQAKLRTRCAECGLRAWFIDGCPNCGRITEVIHDIA